MAKAYACDRCGKLFKREDYEDKVSVVLENGTPFSIHFGNTNIYLSLCPKCRAGFQKWWDTDAVRKTTDPNCPPIVENLYTANEEYEEDEYDIAARIANISSTTSKQIVEENNNEQKL